MRKLVFPKFFLAALFWLLSACGDNTVSTTVYLSWRIVDAKEPSPTTAPSLDCAAKNVAWVRVQLSGQKPFDFPCTAYSGESASFQSGTYLVDMMALNPLGGAVANDRKSMDLFGRFNLGTLVFQVH